MQTLRVVLLHRAKVMLAALTHKATFITNLAAAAGRVPLVVTALLRPLEWAALVPHLLLQGLQLHALVVVEVEIYMALVALAVQVVVVLVAIPV
jgi:hypothetical protein